LQKNNISALAYIRKSHKKTLDKPEQACDHAPTNRNEGKTMKAADIITEAFDYSVEVAEGRDGITRFRPNSGPAVAWCSYLRAGLWLCHNDQGVPFKATTKARAYNWCLDQAVNGTTD
jgi:hypothetical protein